MSKDLIVNVESHSMEVVPAYLSNHVGGGMESLDTTDFQIPRIKLLQPMSPECQVEDGPRPGQFFHAGSNKALGKSLKFIPAVVSKRVILWEPTKTGNGKLLAFSSDGKLWNSGGNAKFDVTLKDDTKATWNTGRGVSDSGLLNWGSSNPKNEKSAPAATLVYEYCCYLPEYPELSPCLIGAYKTSLAPAKKLNTAMLGTRKPAFSIIVQANIKSIPAGNSVYYSPTYNLVGYAAEKDFKIAKELHERYSNISVNVSNYSDAVEHATNDIGLDDEVPF